MITLIEEPPADAAGIEILLDAGFGADRKRKSSYSYRAGVERLHDLCLVAHDGAALVGTLRAWPVRVGLGGAAVLVGPVAVAASHRCQGIGTRLMIEFLDRARKAGWSAAVLVGSRAYYGRFGYAEAATFGISMRLEDPQRVLGLALQSAERMPRGQIAAWRSARLKAA